MARPKRKTAPHSYSHSQAAYILERAISDRKISKADADRYIAEMHEEISTLESRLAHLRDAVVGPVKKLLGGDMPFPLGKQKVAGGDGPFPLKKKKRVSAERKASMQLQGQYLGLMQKLPKSKRAGFKAIAKKDGREKAIAAMKNALGREGNG